MIRIKLLLNTSNSNYKFYRHLTLLANHLVQNMNPYELSHRRNGYRLKSHGFTLIEILVAIVVLSFGLLGMVGIQAMAIKSNNDAKQQSVAVQMATELSDMMRGNMKVAILTTAGTGVGANPYLKPAKVSLDSYTSAATPQCFAATALCLNPTDVANWEIDNWLVRIQNQYVGAAAQVQICFDNNPYDAAGLPQWGCSGVAGTPGNPISIKIGWARASTNSDRSNATVSAFDTGDLRANGAVGRPSVVYTVTPGSPL